MCLPRTSCEKEGMIVMVNHRLKYEFAAPFKIKTSVNVSNLNSMNLFPMMIARLQKILSDNGPKFRGEGFERMLKVHGIQHVMISPFMSSLNGLTERTVKTLSEVLQMMGEDTDEWN